ncbi:MAG: spore germination protein GerW family protein [Peptococcaceae bacterium]|nr:spore germination protein GerW family protein [Peptococcaceae bacterium]MDH7524658.1 spore germination protein GerW family protein [Peptococcaceae bacterium]
MSFHEELEMIFEQLGVVFRTETVIGKPVVIGEIKLIPLVEVGLGLASGGKNGGKDPAFGLVGFGANLRPTGILVIRDDEVSVISLYKNRAEEKEEGREVD